MRLPGQLYVMTPELRNACELVFQEHKSAAAPINWTKDAFRGRLSFGMAALAKETLEKRNIIRPRNPAKKTYTVLNPAAFAAGNFEEAEEIILNNKPVVVLGKEHPDRQYVTHRITASNPLPQESKLNGTASVAETKWWMKPFFCYVLLPIGAAIAGGLITYLLGLLV